MVDMSWKKDVVYVLENNTKDVVVLKDKLLKLVDAFDNPEDFQSAIQKIQGKTDLGIAFMEILREFVDRNLEEVDEEERAPPKRRIHNEEDDDEDDEEEDDDDEG